MTRIHRTTSIWSPFPIGIDTSAYHQAHIESIAFSEGNWMPLGVVPSMELICDPEGIDEKDKYVDWAFPNPTHGILLVRQPADGTLELFDLTGQLLLTSQLHVSSTSVDVSGLPTGLYILKFRSKGRSFSQKIMVE